MSADITEWNYSKVFGEWIRRSLNGSQMVLNSCVDFLKKGAKRRETLLRLKEFKAERLKRVPNYVILEAARKHVRLGIEAVLALSLLANVIFGWQLVSLSDRLSQKRIALVPSRLDQTTEVDVGRISEHQVHSTCIMYLTLLGTVDATNVDENYRILKDFMSPDLRVQFERETRDYRHMIKDEGLSEQVIVNTKRISIENGQIQAEAVVRIRPSIGATIGKVRDEKVIMHMKVITNYEQNQWLLQITSLTRGPIESFSSSGKGI
jgi:hypothetical protein